MTEQAGDMYSETAQLLAALAEDTGAIVKVVDEDFRVIYANNACARSAGIAIADIVGRRLDEIMSSKMARERMDLIADVIRTGRPVALFESIKGVRCRSVIRLHPSPSSGPRQALIVIMPLVLVGAAHDSSERLEYKTAIHNSGDPLEGLTPAETEVLRRIGQGHSTADIAESLGRSVKTIETHRTSLGRKLNAQSRSDLMFAAIRGGLIRCPWVAMTQEN